MEKEREKYIINPGKSRWICKTKRKQRFKAIIIITHTLCVEWAYYHYTRCYLFTFFWIDLLAGLRDSTQKQMKATKKIEWMRWERYIIYIYYTFSEKKCQIIFVTWISLDGEHIRRRKMNERNLSHHFYLKKTTINNEKTGGKWKTLKSNQNLLKNSTWSIFYRSTSINHRSQLTHSRKKSLFNFH